MQATLLELLLTAHKGMINVTACVMTTTLYLSWRHCEDEIKLLRILEPVVSSGNTLLALAPEKSVDGIKTDFITKFEYQYVKILATDYKGKVMAI
ncbi:hypothetical protein CHS0354_033147, partial [Potamilus streckersoni]